MPDPNQPILRNRRARHDYFIEDTFEAGLVLEGTEVKSLRAGKANLVDSYANVENGEVWLHNLHISPYPAGGMWNPDPRRPRKLLLHRGEIRRLQKATEIRGYTLVALSLYFHRGMAKVELGLGRGKKLYDKRDAIAERDAERALAREIAAQTRQGR